MANVAISGDTSGAVTLTVPATAGTQTVTFPAASGTPLVSGNQPAFFVYKSANSGVISNGVFTKITFDTVVFNTNSNFSTSTSVFTPTVAGYYQVNAKVTLNAQNVNPTYGVGSIYKNGSRYVESWCTGNASSLVDCLVSAVIYMNGSTDYLEFYGRLDNATNGIWQGGNLATVFGACLVRTA